MIRYEMCLMRYVRKRGEKMNDINNYKKSLEGLKEDSDWENDFPIEFFIERGEKLIKNIRG